MLGTILKVRHYFDLKNCNKREFLLWVRTAQIFRAELAYYCGNIYLHKSPNGILLPVNLMCPLSSSSLIPGGADQPQGKSALV